MRKSIAVVLHSGAEMNARVMELYARWLCAALLVELFTIRRLLLMLWPHGLLLLLLCCCCCCCCHRGAALCNYLLRACLPACLSIMEDIQLPLIAPRLIRRHCV